MGSPGVAIAVAAAAACVTIGTVVISVIIWRRRRRDPPNTLVGLEAGTDSSQERQPKHVHRSSVLRARLRSPLGTYAGRAGLVNLGNTCFMNAALQCLSHSRYLTAHFLTNGWEADLNEANALGSGGKLARAYVQLLKQLWYGDHPAVSPTQFKAALERFSPMFEGTEQHDAQELVTFLLDGLHEDLNRVVGKKPYIEDLGELKPGHEEEIVAAEAWGNYLKRDRSVIVDLFQGQLKSTVTCSECGCESAKFEAFMYLSLPLPQAEGSTSLTLDACLREFHKAEQLDPDNLWRCPRCKDFRAATKQLQLWKLPPHLLIHLKRFRAGARGQHTKREATVETPLENLDLAPYAMATSHRATYSLFAVCNHHGSMGSGHYTAHCRSAGFTDDDDRSKWHTLNDATCRGVEPEQVISSANYLLFFERAGPVDGTDGSSELQHLPRRQTLSRPELWPFRMSQIPQQFLPPRSEELRSSRSSCGSRASFSSPVCASGLGSVAEGG